MDDKFETAENLGRTPLSRRTITTGIAWGVPAITVLGATPAMAVTPLGQLAFTTAPQYIFAGTFINGVHQDGTGNVAAVIFAGSTPAVNAQQTITVTLGAASAFVILAANATSWSVSLDASLVDDGVGQTVTASSNSAQVTSATTTITKDTVAPAPSVGTLTYTQNTQSLSVPFSRGTATTPSSDSSSVTLTLSGEAVGNTPRTATNVTASPHVFVKDVQKKTYTLTITQTDAAGNSGSQTTTGTVS